MTEALKDGNMGGVGVGVFGKIDSINDNAHVLTNVFTPLQNEAMTGIYTHNSIFSRITLAMMEDTG